MKTSYKQFVKFCFVGAINTILDIVFYYIFTRFFTLHFLLANMLSFLIAVSNSFFLNKSFTFKVKESKKYDYLKFTLVSIIGLLITEIVLFASVHYLGLLDLYGKVLAIFFTVIWNFFASKFFVFKDRHED